MHKLFGAMMILGIWAAVCFAEDQVTFQKINGDPNHLEMTTVSTKVEIVDLDKLKNQVIDRKSNLDYKVLTCANETAVASTNVVLAEDIVTKAENAKDADPIIVEDPVEEDPIVP